MNAHNHPKIRSGLSRTLGLLTLACLLAGLAFIVPGSCRAQGTRSTEGSGPHSSVHESLQSNRTAADPGNGSGHPSETVPPAGKINKTQERFAKTMASRRYDPMTMPAVVGFILLGLIILLLLFAHSHRRRAIKSLQSARDRYQKMFDNTAVALFEKDCLEVKKEIEQLKAQGITDMPSYLESHPQQVDAMLNKLKILDVNPAALRLYGADSKDDLIQSFGRIFTPDATGGFKQVLCAIAEEGSYCECETVSRKLTGQRIHVIISATLPSQTEEFASIIISVLDITERKRSLEVMHRSEERFRTVFNNAASGMALVDLRGHYIRVNEAFQHMLGYTGKELEWKNWREVTAPDDIGLTKKMIISLIAGHRVQPLEKRYITKEGTIVWGLLNMALIVNKHRKPLYYIVQVQDISRLKEEQKKMRQREERYRQIFEADLSGFFIAGPDGELLLCNQVFADILGYTYVEEAIGTNLSRVCKDPKTGAELLRHLTEKSKPEPIEVELVRRDGAEIHVRLNGTGRFNDRHELIEILGYVMDITRQKHLEARLLHSREISPTKSPQG